MALNEACAVWIEQRITEELDGKEENGKSLREIGRIIAAEAEKHFEAKVSPRTMYSRVRKAADQNQSQAASSQNSDENSGNSGNISMSEAAQRVEAIVEGKGLSERKAVEIVAEETSKYSSRLKQSSFCRL